MCSATSEIMSSDDEHKSIRRVSFTDHPVVIQCADSTNENIISGVLKGLDFDDDDVKLFLRVSLSKSKTHRALDLHILH